MTFLSGLKTTARRWWISHVAAILAGAILGVLFANRSLESARDMGGMFEREPFEHAVSFAYAWGSAADASALLGRYAARLRDNPNWEPLAGPGEVAFTEFRKAIVEHQSGKQIAELCRATPKCNPDNVDALISKLLATRKVSDPR